MITKTENQQVYLLWLLFFQLAAAKYPRKSSTTTLIGSLSRSRSLDSINESKRGNLRSSSWVSFCENEK